LGSILVGSAMLVQTQRWSSEKQSFVAASPRPTGECCFSWVRNDGGDIEAWRVLADDAGGSYTIIIAECAAYDGEQGSGHEFSTGRRFGRLNKQQLDTLLEGATTHIPFGAAKAKRSPDDLGRTLLVRLHKGNVHVDEYLDPECHGRLTSGNQQALCTGSRAESKSQTSSNGGRPQRIHPRFHFSNLWELRPSESRFHAGFPVGWPRTGRHTSESMDSEGRCLREESRASGPARRPRYPALRKAA
jgi:hypothetical protein